MGINPSDFARMQQRIAASAKVIFPENAVEHEVSGLHKPIIEECARRGWIALHSRTDRSSTINVGAPDFVIVADGGRVFLIECKAKRGKRKPAQLAFAAWSSKLGLTTHCIYSMEEFYQIIK